MKYVINTLSLTWTSIFYQKHHKTCNYYKRNDLDLVRGVSKFLFTKYRYTEMCCNDDESVSSDRDMHEYNAGALLGRGLSHLEHEIMLHKWHPKDQKLGNWHVFCMYGIWEKKIHTIKRWTSVLCCCPIRCTLPTACASAAGFSSGSTRITCWASKRFSPFAPCWIKSSSTLGDLVYVSSPGSLLLSITLLFCSVKFLIAICDFLEPYQDKLRW